MEERDLIILRKAIFPQLNYWILRDFLQISGNRPENDVLHSFYNIASDEYFGYRRVPEHFFKVIDGQRQNRPRQYYKCIKINPGFGIVFANHQLSVKDCYCDVLEASGSRLVTIKASKLIYNGLISDLYYSIPMTTGCFLPDTTYINVKTCPISYLRINENVDLSSEQLHDLIYTKLKEELILDSDTTSVCLIVFMTVKYNAISDSIQRFMQDHSEKTFAVWGGIQPSRECVCIKSNIFQERLGSCGRLSDCLVTCLAGRRLRSYSTVIHSIGSVSFQVEQFRNTCELKTHTIALVYGGTDNEVILNRFKRCFDTFFEGVPLIGFHEFSQDVVGVITSRLGNGLVNLTFENAISLLILTYDNDPVLRHAFAF